MTYYEGKTAYVGLKKQAARGTAETTASIFIATEDYPTLKMESINTYAKEFRGAIGEIQQVYRKPTLKSTGAITSPAWMNFLTYAAYGVMGANTAGGDIEGYTHAITANATTLPIWTIFTGSDNATNVRKWRDMTFKSLTLEMPAGDFVKMTVDMEGGPVDIATAALTPSYDTNLPFFTPNASISIGGSEDCDIEEFKITIGRAPAFKKTMCAAATAFWTDNFVYPTTVMAEGEYTMYFDGYDEYEYWLGANNATAIATTTFAKANAVRALTVTITSLEEVKAAGTATYGSCTITMPTVIYDTWEPEITWDDRVKVKVEFKAIHDATTETGAAGTGTVKIDLVSDVADPAA